MTKILLVEDNEMNRDMLSRRLARKGFEVVMAVDGLQGVAMASAEMPHLILMDMSLPGIDGWEATRRVKANASTQAIPVIALTAHAMADDREKALAAGCDEFDTKPVDLARLLGKIESLLATPASTEERPGHNTITTATSLTLPALAASLPAFKTELEHFCSQAGIDARVHEDMQVVLDEVCANVFKHAYPREKTGALRLDVRVDAQRAPLLLELSFSDQGQPFNPLDKAAPDLALAWQERPIGGLGIHLVQSLTDQQLYSRSETHGNRFTLVKHLHSLTPSTLETSHGTCHPTP